MSGRPRRTTGLRAPDGTDRYGTRPRRTRPLGAETDRAEQPHGGGPGGTRRGGGRHGTAPRGGGRPRAGARRRPAARPGVRGPAVLLLVAAVTALGAGPAQAEGYRYWSFWQRDGGSWSYATEGPATARPADGDVEGFRFSVSVNTQDAAKPRGTAGFDEICAGIPAEDGRKRVALLLDFGTAEDAPDGERPPEPRTECASVPEDATSGEALAAVAKPLRYNTSALLCAIAGYPERGCGEQVSGDAGAADGGADPSGGSGSDGSDDGRSGDDRAGEPAGGDGGGSSTGLYAGAAAVAVLAAGAAWQARRRRG